MNFIDFLNENSKRNHLNGFMMGLFVGSISTMFIITLWNMLSFQIL